MAEVRKVRLLIEEADQDHRWEVSVKYEIRFAAWEVDSAISEVVEVRGGTPQTDTGARLRLRHRPWKLRTQGAKKDGEHHVIERTTKAQTLGPDELDVSPDERVLLVEETRVGVEPSPGETAHALSVTDVREATLLREDSLYARVELVPHHPRPDSKTSDVTTGQFGAES